MTLPFNPLLPDRQFGPRANPVNPFDRRSGSVYTKPLAPVKITAKRPTWSDVKSGSVGAANTALGTRAMPNVREVAEDVRAKARAAYARGGTADGGTLTQEMYKRAAQADILMGSMVGGATDPMIIGKTVEDASRQFGDIASGTGTTLSQYEAGIPAVLGGLAGGTAAFMTGSRLLTGGLAAAGRAMGATRAATGVATKIPTIGKMIGAEEAALAATRAAVYTGRGAKLANIGKTIERARDARNTEGSIRAALKAKDLSRIGASVRGAGTALAKRGAAELLPAVPLNMAQGALDKEGGETSAMAADALGYKGLAASIRERKGRVAGMLENQAMDFVGFGVMESLAKAVRMKITSGTEIGSTAAGALVGAATDEEDRLRGAGVGAVAGLVGARGGAIGLSQRIVGDARVPILVNGMDVSVPAPFKAKSAGLEAIAKAPQEKGDAGYWAGVLAKGTRKAELEDSRFNEWLGEQKGTLTKVEVANALRERLPVLGASDRGSAAGGKNLQAEYQRTGEIRDAEATRHQTLLRSGTGTREEIDASHARFLEAEAAAVDAFQRYYKSTPRTKFDQYKIPGESTNYSELVTKVESNSYKVGDKVSGLFDGDWEIVSRGDDGYFTLRGAENPLTETRMTAQGLDRAMGRPAVEPYRHEGHWPGVDNPIAHLRLDERVVNGERALVLQESQADAQQAARKKDKKTKLPAGYRTPESERAYNAARENTARLTEETSSTRKAANQLQIELREADPEYVELTKQWNEANSNREAMIQSMVPPAKRGTADEGAARSYAFLSLESSPITARIKELSNRRSAALSRAAVAAREHPEVQALWKRAEELEAETTRAIETLPKRGAVPDLPFKKTPQWTELNLKRALEEAVKRGVSRVILPLGRQAADMFSLRTVADRLEWKPFNVKNQPDGFLDFDEMIGGSDEASGTLTIYKEGRGSTKKELTEEELEENVGREIAELLIANGRVEGDELEVGGRGMTTYYEDIVPKVIKDYAKKLGVKIDVEKVGGQGPDDKSLQDTYERLALRREDAQRELRDAEYARTQIGARDWQLVDEANARIRRARVAVQEAALESAEASEAMYRNRADAAASLADNLSFRMTPELKAAVEAGQPLYALGAMALGDDDERNGGMLAALALGTLSRNVKNLPTNEILKIGRVSEMVAKGLDHLDPETGYAPEAYGAARAMRDRVRAMEGDPKKIRAAAKEMRQMTRVLRGIKGGNRKSRKLAVELSERMARGMDVLARELERPRQAKEIGDLGVLGAARAAAAERLAANPDLARIAANGTSEERVVAVLGYFRPLLRKAAEDALREHGTMSKWYDSAVQDAQAIATLMMPELSEPNTFALFNYVSAALSNGNPVTPEFRAGTVAFDQFLRTGKLSIYHLDPTTKAYTPDIPVWSTNKGEDILKARPLMAISDDGDVLKGGPRLGSWERTLSNIQEVLDAHGGSIESAMTELMGRGLTDSGLARVRGFMAEGKTYKQAIELAQIGNKGKPREIFTKSGSEAQLRATQLMGPKLGQYSTDRTIWMRGLLGNPMDPAILPKATNDMWIARGYNTALAEIPFKVELEKNKEGVMVPVEKINDGVSGPMHDVLNDVQRRLGQEFGLEPRDVQALLWESLKSESQRFGGGLEEGAFDTLASAAARWASTPPAPRLVGEVEGLARRKAAEMFIDARNKTKRPGFLSPLSPDDLFDRQIYLMHNGTVGYAIDPLGDMQNLFNNGGPKGAGTVAIMDALANGGKTLDAFSGHLTRLYSQLGFVETGRMDFDPAYMPKGWDVDEDGTPDVVFMAWRGLPGTPEETLARAKDKPNWKTYEPTKRRFTDYDEAKRDALATYERSAGDAERSREAVRAYVDNAGSANGAQGDGSLQSVRRAGSLNPTVAGALAGAGTGAVVGSVAGAYGDRAIGDDESTREGATAGLLAGMLAGSAGGAMTLRRFPALLGGRTGATLATSSPAVAKVLKSIATGERDLAPPPSLFGSGVAQAANRAYAAIIDDVWALRKLGRDVSGDAPLSGLDAQLRQSTRWQTWGSQRVTADLKPVLQMAKGREGDVMVLLKARRDLQLRAQAAADKSEFTMQELFDAANDASADPKTVAAADAVQDYYRRLLDWKLDEKLLTPEAHAAIVASEDYYTPFLREWDQEQMTGGGAGFMAGGKAFNKGKGVRKMDREQRARAKTTDPFEIAVLDTFKTAQLVGKQRVMQMVSAMVEANGGEIPNVLKRVSRSDRPDPLGRRIEAIVNGELATYEVLDPDVLKALSSFGPKTQVPALLRMVKEFKRATITSLPDFMVRNLLRDNAQVALGNPVSGRAIAGGTIGGAALGAASAYGEEGDDVWAKAAYRAIAGAGLGSGGGVLLPQMWRTMRGVTDIMAASDSPLTAFVGRTTGGNSQVWNDFLTDGAASIGHYARDTNDARRVIRTLRGDRSPAGAFINPKRWWQAMEAMGSTLENAPRLATYKTSLQTNPGDRALAAARAADVSLDFSRKGGSSFQQGLNETNAFFNARLQGWDKLGRMAKDPRTWAVGFATLTAPSIGNWMMIHADEESRESYYQHPSWVRNTFWLVPTGGGEFVYIPKPFELGTIFATIPERMLDWAYTSKYRGDARPGESAGNTARELLSSTVAVEAPLTDFAKPLLEQSLNYDMFRNRPIVPSETYSSAKTLPEFQQDDETSKVAKLLGERFGLMGIGLSPQRIDHLVGAYGGSAGKIAMRAGNSLLPGEDVSRTAGRMPVVGDLVAGFTDRKGTTSDDEVTVRRRFERVQRVDNALRPLMKVAEDEAADPMKRDAARRTIGLLMEREAKTVGEGGQDMDGLTIANDALTKLREAARDEQRDRTLSREERTGRLEALAQYRARVARAAAAGRYDEVAAIMAELEGEP